MCDSKSKFEVRLPTKLVIGQKTTFSIPIVENFFMDQNPLRIGIRDSFNRIHWAPKEDLKETQRVYAEYKRSHPPH
jgi:hypothetical protein